MAIALDEIAERIAIHLAKLEASQPQGGHQEFWHSGAMRRGRYIGIVYLGYRRCWPLTKTQALRYLAWLDAGNKGKHWAMLREGGRE